VAGLRAAGHDLLYIREVAVGADDGTVLQMATNESRILITEDKDFGELVVRLRLPAIGILLIRMEPADSSAKLARLLDVIRSHGDRLAGAFVVVDETKVRIRPL
jgi:predicted nuclease of predicted toxin-antitoxin system